MRGAAGRCVDQAAGTRRITVKSANSSNREGPRLRFHVLEFPIVCTMPFCLSGSSLSNLVIQGRLLLIQVIIFIEKDYAYKCLNIVPD